MFIQQDTPPENDVLAKCGEWRGDENAKSGDAKSGDEWTDEDTKIQDTEILERDNVVMI